MDNMAAMTNGLPNNHFRNDTQGDRTSWEYHTVSVTRVSGYGFGIAVSGGRDNPHFANGDPSIAVSDVLKGGPAEERLQVNDRIISVNGVSLENVEYATAVQVLRDSGNTVTLMVKRRVPHMGLMAPNMPHAMSSLGGGAIGGHPHTGHHHQLSHLSGGGGPSGPSGPIINAFGPASAAAAPLQMLPNQQHLKAVLTKPSKKDDFGIVLGCRLFVKEISAKARDQLALNGYTLHEGDIVTRLHNTSTNDAMSLKEARKIIDSCKERLSLSVLREIAAPATAALPSLPPPPQSPVYSHTAQPSNCSNVADDASMFAGANSYSAQNLYVQPPTRPSNGGHDDKSNLTPRGRSRNPLMDVSLLQLDRPSTPRDLPPAPPVGSDGADADPPRPPPPREEDFYASRRQLYEEDPLRRSKQSAEPRFISFQKEGSVGIRLTGGNEAGIFVTAVQPGSPASLQGLTPGDKILKVNDMDMAGVTREEAVLFLLSLQDRIDLIVQHCREEYDHAVANQRGDSFHIKTHFHCDNPTKGEMSFKAGDIFRVVDTLHNGVVGAWQVLRIGRGQQEIQRGVIPNKARAEELATAQFNANKKEASSSESRTSFFRRRRPTHRRSKSLSRENWDDVVFSDSTISKFPAYERVVLRHPGFVRPVVMFGPVADLARERLMKDFPDKFTAPAQGVQHADDGDDGDKSGSKCGIVRLSNIRDIMDRGKHALLDITPNAVDRLNYAQFYPIVVFLKADNKHQIKQLRQGIPKSVHKSSKKLLDQCQKLDRVWSHVFSGVLLLNDADTWYRKLRDTIDQLQSGAIWMSENKPVESLSDDFLFPMNTTSRLSYASSPESDLEMSPGPSTSLSLGNLPQLVKSSSDPSIATNQDLLEREREMGNMDEALPPPYSTNGRPNAKASTSTIANESKYGFTGDDKTAASDPTKHSQHHAQPSSVGAPFYGKVPELPPRIDRASKPPGGYPNSPPPAPGIGRPPMSPDPSATATSSASGTFRRPTTAQDRLFGARNAATDGADFANGGPTTDLDYGSAGLEPPGSLDRSLANGNALLMSPSKRSVAPPAQNGGAYPPPPPPANGSYDSVSSYDSCNTTQLLQQQQQRLGPNVPDDLKSVPAATLSSRLNELMIGQPNAPDHHPIGKRPSMHEHARSNAGPPPNGRQSSPGRAPFAGPGVPAAGHPALSVMQRPSHLGLDMAPPPTKKPQPGGVETKTDYGKYSRNNSASQADYAMRTPGSPQIGNGGAGPVAGLSSGNNGAVPFKPVPPPKPKNYHPPVQRNAQMGNGYWENGASMEPSSPRSPSGFYYPPAPSHYHHNQTGHMQPPPPPPHHQHQPSRQPYGGQYAPQQPPPPQHYNGGHQQPAYGFHGGVAPDYQHHRAPGMGKSVPPLPPGNHPSERSALDLAGSREQRGSAFELYRKPQIGNVGGHHHNMSDMESTSSANSGNPYGPFRYADNADPYYPAHDNQYRQQPQHQQHPQSYPYADEHGSYASHRVPHPVHHYAYDGDGPPPLPPPLKPKKKMSMLKSPFSALRKAFNKTTKPLRRQNSMIEPSTAGGDRPHMTGRPHGSGLRRQHSMLEPSRPVQFTGTPDMSGQRRRHYYSEDRDATMATYERRPEAFGAHDPYADEAIYGNCTGAGAYYAPAEEESLYANRNAVAFERSAASQPPPERSATLGRRIVRRHSTATDRHNANDGGRGRSEPRTIVQQHAAPAHGRYDVPPSANRPACRYDVPPPPEPVQAPDGDIYQTRSGAYMMDTVLAARRQQQQHDEAIYQSRREMHRDHLYQSRAEMQQRLQQGRAEADQQQRRPDDEPRRPDAPPSGSSGTPSTASTPSAGSESPGKDGVLYQSRRELKERGYRTRTQLRDHIYQSRREAMQSMAEPVYVSRREMRPEPIYEVRESQCLDGVRIAGVDEAPIGADSPGQPTDDDATRPNDLSLKDVIDHLDNGFGGPAAPAPDDHETSMAETSMDETQDATDDEFDDAEGEETLTSTRSQNQSDMQKTITAGGVERATPPLAPMTPRSMRDPFHISNMIRRIGPVPPSPTAAADVHPFRPQLHPHASRTSIETQFTTCTASGASMISLPTGPPNAQSTPYASQMALPANASPAVPALREQTTTRGVFDETGGVLCDDVWNVSVSIPAGAIAPGVQQEIYFTVTDPRMSQVVGGPPLDMENGETMLSPLVMCGPQGIEFLRPVTLNIPHCAGRTTSLGLALKATDSESDQRTNWDNIDLPSNTAAHTVSVQVDHF